MTNKITIESVFPDFQSNENLKQMFSIINYRKQNQLKKIPVKDRTSQYVYCEIHHIIPKSWYKWNKLPIDNSSYNKVNLTAKEHILVHLLLKKYFFEKNNEYMIFAMNDAFLKMMHGNVELANAIEKDKELLDILEFEILESKKLLSLARSRSSKKYWESLTPKEKKKQIAKRTIKIKSFWANLSKDDYIEICTNMKIGHSKISLEKKEEIGNRISNSLKKYFQSLSEKEKNELSKQHSKQAILMWQSFSNVKKEEIGRRISNSLKNNNNLSKIRSNSHKKMSLKTKKLRKIKISETNKLTWKNKPKEEKDLQKKRMSLAKIGRKWMSNDLTKKAIQVKPEDVIIYINDGYVFGDHRNKWKQENNDL